MSRATLSSEQGFEWFEGSDSVWEVLAAEPFVERSPLTAGALERFFVAAREFWMARPWEMTDDEPIFHLEAPALGIDDGCLSIIGGLGGTRGFAFYPSVQDYEQVIEAASGAWSGARPTPHCALYFSFDAAECVPAGVRKKIAARGLLIADEAAYPNLQSVTYGSPTGLLEVQLRLATAIMRGLVTLAEEHRQTVHAGEEVYQLHRDEDGLEIVLAFPHPLLAYQPEPRPRAPTLSSPNPYHLPLEARELEKLEHALRSFTLHRAVGMFCAVCSVPELPSPVTWLGEIIRNLPPGNGSQRCYALDQLEVVYDHVIRTFREGDIDRLIPEAGDVAACREWSRGYASLLGRVDPSDFEVHILDAAFPIQALAEIPEALAWLEEFRGEESRSDAMSRYRESLAEDAHYLLQAWDYARAQQEAKTVQRATPKLGRNEACKCGSGKKFKKCCAV
jgi:uncharacterized protein